MDGVFGVAGIAIGRSIMIFNNDLQETGNIRRVTIARIAKSAPEE